ncbi:hypothetical protein BDF19DRAFT_431652 [Syncephalis fuscata]|nr:hypothetical protein BDF19DRAFT_431652 [Syncephalis fuscata]
MTRTPKAPLTLYSWAGRWNLPSIDPFCLGIQAFLLFIKADWSVYNANDPTISPNGELPVLKIGDHKVVSGSENIIQYLQDTDYDLDAELTKKQQADAIAYRAMVDHTLYNAQLYEWFQVEENFVSVVRPVYSNLSPLHTRYIVPIRMRNAAKERLATPEYGVRTDKAKSDDNELEMEEQAAGIKNISKKKKLLDQVNTNNTHIFIYLYILISSFMVMLDYTVCTQLLYSLSAKLGLQPYFFGSNPSSLDAVVYGHLALHLYADEFRQSTLRQMLISDFPLLVAYCDKIRAYMSTAVPQPLEAFPPLPATFSGILALPARVLLGGDGWMAVQNYWSSWRQAKPGADEHHSRKQANQSDVSPQEERSFVQKRWLSIIGGIGLMIGYILWNGIISIEFSNEEEEEEDNETEQEKEEFPTLTSQDLLKSVF